MNQLEKPEKNEKRIKFKGKHFHILVHRLINFDIKKFKVI